MSSPPRPSTGSGRTGEEAQGEGANGGGGSGRTGEGGPPRCAAPPATLHSGGNRGLEGRRAWTSRRRPLRRCRPRCCRGLTRRGGGCRGARRRRLRHPRVGGHAAADAGRPRHPRVPRLPAPVPHLREPGRCARRRGHPGVGGHGLQPAGAEPAAGRAGGGRAARRRAAHRPKALRSLPGVGEYTANALACFAQGRQVAVVDTNVRRVLGRVFHWPSTPTDREVAETAERVLPEGKAWAWNQALMDLGATVCTSRRPTCLLCPVRAACRAAGAFEAEAAPACGRGGAGWVSGQDGAVRGVEPVLPWSGRGAPARACRGGVVRAGRAGRCRAARVLGRRRAVAARGAGGPCAGRARRGARRGGLDAGQPAVATREASPVAGGHGCVYHSDTWQLGRVDPRR